MTEIFPPQVRGPRTHALVIGVGSYTHLRDGKQPLDLDIDLGQLSSPPYSAIAFSDWLTTSFNNPEAQLGSVELLLSQTQSYTPLGGRPINIEAATMFNVKAAFQRWYARCDSNKDNIALFFFCGHGLLKTNLYLLLEDFGADPKQKFNNAIDLEGLHAGMTSQCKARAQCFFADACQQVPYEMLARIKPKGETFLDYIEGVFLPEDAPIYYASTPTYAAYGLGNEPTMFTQALLDALKGIASHRSELGWAVGTDRLFNGIRISLNLLIKEKRVPKQKPIAGGKSAANSILSLLRGEPTVPVRIVVFPDDAAKRAILSVEPVGNPALRLERKKKKGEWQLKLPPGDYDGSAHFPRGEYQDDDWRVQPIPPETFCPWEVA